MFHTRGLHVYFKMTLNRMGQYLGVSTNLEQHLHMYNSPYKEIIVVG